jgi:hypothetical protein
MDKPKITKAEHVLHPDTVKQYEEAKRIRAELTDDPCPYCSRPEGHDACPIHSH